MNWTDILSAAGTLLMGAITWAVKNWIKNQSVLKLFAEADDLLRTRVDVCYKTMVLPKIEAAQSDGKIDAEERKDLLAFVWNTALQEATGPLYTFLRQKGEAWAHSRVEDILLNIKAKAAQAGS